MPDALIGAIAMGPLAIVDGASRALTGLPVAYSEAATAQLPALLRAWLRSSEVSITPGWALLAGYVFAVGSGVPSLIANVRASRAARSSRAAESASKELADADPPLTPDSPAA